MARTSGRCPRPGLPKPVRPCALLPGMPATSGPDLVLVRPGETEWSRSGRHTGRTDLPLTEVGEEQARSLRRLVSGQSFALVLSSLLARAVRTAELAGVGAP